MLSSGQYSIITCTDHITYDKSKIIKTDHYDNNITENGRAKVSVLLKYSLLVFENFSKEEMIRVKQENIYALMHYNQKYDTPKNGVI